MTRRFLVAVLATLTVSVVFAQSPSERSLADGTALRATAAEAHEVLGRIYTFKGWQ